MKKRIFFALVFLLSGIITVQERTEKAKIKVLGEKIIYEDWNITSASLNSEIKEELSQTDELFIQLELDYGNDFVAPENDLDDDSSHEEVEEYNKKLREEGKKYHYIQNKNIERKLDIGECNSIYIAEYAPFLEFTINKEDYLDNNLEFILDLVDNRYVECAYVRGISDFIPESFEMESQITSFLETMNSGVNCSDVKVGILEPGIIRKTHANIVGTNYLIRDVLLYIETPTDHATQMASVIGGNTGLAKGCKILSAEMYGTPNAKMDWFLNNGANIVNMSYGESSATGCYSSESAYMDYIAYNYKLTIVASAGNRGETTGYVGNPGLGYNVITVGSTNFQCNTIAAFSSYNVVTGPKKPTIVAPGVGYSIPNFSGSHNGTSLSTALTTAEIAVIMQLYPAWKLRPDRIIALLAANSVTLSSQTPADSSGLDNKIGAGQLNFGNMKTYITRGYPAINTSPSIGKYVHDFAIVVESNPKVKIALAWLAKSNQTTTGTAFTNYDIRIFLGDVIYFETNSSLNNLEVLDVTLPGAGIYRVAIIQKSVAISANEEVSMYYRFC